MPRLCALMLMLSLAGCGVLPDIGGEGGASPERRSVQELLAGGSEEAARALLDAWRDGNRSLADRAASEEAVNALFRVPYPDAPPRLVSCEADARVPDGERCFFQLDGGGVVLLVLPRAEEEGWEVRSVSFLDR